MHMLASTPSHEILRSNSEISALYDDWIVQNKSRVYTKSRKLVNMKTESTKAATQAVKQATTLASISNGKKITSSSSLQVPGKSTSVPVKSTTPYAVSSLQSVFASRKDIPADDIPVEVDTITYNKPTQPENVQSVFSNIDTLTENESKHVTAMGYIETKMMIHVCDNLLATTPPYSSDTSLIDTHTLKGERGVGNRDMSSVGTTAVPIASTCCAQLRTNNGCLLRKIYLPICSSSPDQVLKCQNNTIYNSNVQTNIAKALTAANARVIIRSPESQTIDTKLHERVDRTGSEEVDVHAVYIDTNTPVQSLVTPHVLEGIIFGDSCTTSSTDFAIDKDVGVNYAHAIEAFQQYGSTRIGENITLTPSFFKKAPTVFSLSCPSLKMSEIVTGFSAVRDNEKLGPNHPNKMVEVMSNLVPFINKCCEAQMGLSSETVEDLVEDKAMPIATTSSIEHCFAYEPQCGVSVYVGSHYLKLSDLDHLNSYIISDGTDSQQTEFPASKRFVVHVSSIFSGPVAPENK